MSLLHACHRAAIALSGVVSGAARTSVKASKALRLAGLALAIPVMIGLAGADNAHAQATTTLARSSGSPVASGATTTYTARIGAFGTPAPTGNVSFSSNINGSLGTAPLTAFAQDGAAGAGGSHSCALTPGGGVKCWGLNYYGELGTYSNFGSPYAVLTVADVAGLGDVVAIATGDSFNCALIKTGTVMCWGANFSGQLGRGTAGAPTPAVGTVSGVAGAVAIAAGSQHTCALLDTGRVSCWGSNTSGQLGNGDVQALSGIVSLSANGSTTCVLLNTGKVMCWGAGSSGQLGVNSNGGDSASPVEIAGLSDAVAISVGVIHACAVTSTGTVKCWGSNYYGQLGTSAGIYGSNGNPTPTEVAGLTGVAAVSAGYYHTCALTSAGGVKCWGNNGNGQLGSGSGFGASNGAYPTPAEIAGLTGVIAISTLASHNCAVQSTGNVQCWGKNSSGELGDGSTTNRYTLADIGGGLAAKTMPAARVSTSGLSVGTHTITMSYPGDGNYTSSSSSVTMTVIGTPTVTAISPATGPSAGGTMVTVTGTNFASVTSVTFGGVAAIYAVNSTTQITAQAPAGVGVVDVVVTAGSSSSPTSAADRFTYIPAPTVTSIAPTSGLAAGGASVTVTGTSFSNAMRVVFGGQDAASFTVDSATQITAVSPPGSGAVHVVVTTPGGTSPAIAADVFTYIPPPDMWSVNPAFGKIQGGAQVTIKGVNLQGVTGLTFGGTPVTSMTVVDSTTILVTVPPHASGLVDAVATSSYGTSTKTNFFFYVPLPQIQSVTPSSGPTTGNTTVTIDGVGLIYTTAVTFGGVPATSFDTSSGSLVAVTPAHVTGSVDIAVTTRGGDDMSSNAFTFVSTPTALSLTAMKTPTYAGQTTKLIARVTTQNAGAPTGNVTFSSSIDGALTPVALEGTASSPSFATGDTHSCAVTAAGTVSCFGSNLFGQLGNSTGVGTTNAYPTPTDIGLSDVVSVTAGQRHSCALLRTGGVKCWGANQYGQLGNATGVGTTNGYATPADVAGLSGIVAIAAGYTHTCAITLTGGVKCWGRNNFGQLGNTPLGSSATPYDVIGISGAVAIAAGESHSCALLDTGGLKCWGRNVSGQLGVTGVTTSPTPVDVTGLSSGVKAIAAGQDFSCGATTGGGVKCWGLNRYGQLGNATNMGVGTANPAPADVAGLSGVTAIAAGALHACALKDGGEVDCWGYNGNGQLGNYLSGTTPSPVTFDTLTPSVAVFGGANQTCTLSFSGAIRCAGLDSYGQLGFGNGAYLTVPAEMSGVTPAIATRAVLATASLSAGSHVVTAAYGGDGNHSGNSNTAVQDIVGAPIVTGVTPAAGPTGGGGSVVISGSNFTAVSGVTFGGASATFTVDSDVQITATVPAHAAGTVDVVVTSPAGSNTPDTASAYAYVAAPVVTSLSPTAGPESGGTSLVITGTGFNNATALTFGATAALSFSVNSNTQITALAPSGTGTVDVRITTVGGTSAVSAADQFTYVAAPTVTSISPTAGPAAGGTSVVITGTNFSGTTAVTFGSTAATGFTVDSTTQVTATAPGGTGVVDVRVTTIGGTSATSAADQYTYIPAPTIASVGPATGPTIGGTSVVIIGTNFAGASAVTFDGIAAAGYTVDSTTQITATTPAHAAGSVAVAVTTTGGTVTSSGAYAYQLSPTAMLLGTAKTPEYLTQPVTLTARMTSYGGGMPTGNVAFSSNKDGAIGSAVLDVVGGASIANGAYHSCALKSDGTAACWGWNAYGQLGNGHELNSAVPVAVSGLSAALGLAAGYSYTCALKSDGTVACWGINSYGQLGNGGTTDSTVPVAVSGLSGVVALAAGAVHNCALNSDGTVACWGDNSYGQLGTGGTTSSSVPVAVPGLSGVVALVAATYHTCALKSDGTAACWGWNAYGQLGNGGTTDSTVPVAVSGLSGVTALVASAYNTCALKSDGTAACWGWNGNGQLGNGGTTDSAIPVAVSGLSGVVALAAGTAYSCALKSDGTAACWGWNGNGRLGNGGTTDSTVPVAVSGLSGAVVLVAGSAHSCALKSDGSMACWGYNYYGQLGDGTNTERYTPTAVLGVTAAINAKAILTTSALTAGSHVITATYAGDGNHATSNTTVAQDVIGLPVVTSLSPSAGPLTGGTSVVIAGTNFIGATAVKFGSLSATFTVDSDTQISATSPAHAAGTVDIAVTTPAGTSVSGAADQFTYFAPPTFVSLAPVAGPIAGGTAVTLTGTNLTGVTSATFDGIAASSVSVVNATTVTAVTPAHVAGVVDVVITTPGGVAASVSAYTYAGVPTLASLAPTAGPIAGGTTVTLTGTNMTSASSVTFDGIAATSFSVVNATTVTAVTPAHVAGAVDVVITTPGGIATATAAYTYAPPPTLSSLAPTVGPVAGGTVVTLTGTNLTGASSVTFGGLAASSVSVVSATAVTAVTPAHVAGAVDVLVTTPGGPATLAGGFTYTNGTLQVTGPASMIALGPQEGPFNPPSFSYLVKSSIGPLNWQLSGVPDWLTVSPAMSGSTDASGTTVTFTANTAATTKAVGAYGVSNVTFTNTDNGQGNTSRSAGLTVSPKACEVISRGPEFNGDGKGDILWRSDAGAVGLWFMNGASLSSGPTLSTVPTDWRLIGAGDFDGDGKSDLLWRNTVTGTAAVWFVSGVTVTGTVTLGTVSSDWHIVGTGDFDGDHKADVLWRHDSGTLAIWYGTGATGQGRVTVGTIDMTWRLAAIADFDGDGKSDLLWRSTSGTVAVWLMNGAATKGSASLGVVGPDWRIHGVGDFNGDGKADILWRSDSGIAALWFMNGTALASTGTIGTVTSDWHVAGVNDFNGDGKADLLWRQDNGTLGVWLMNGAALSSSGGLAGVGLDWHLVNGEHDRPLTLIAPGPC